jgi:phage terminase Nu1 subunit (DNA packaging protein)
MKYSVDAKTTNETTLGEPLSVYDTARLIGCSAWTVRQKHVHQGLPCFRSGPAGRLTFYRNQIVAWILEKQKEQKGGNHK